MENVLPVKLAKTWPQANKKYGWVPEVEALPVEYNTLRIAEMSGKHVLFLIKNRKKGFVISPELAFQTIQLYKSVFTRSYDGKVIAVIPSSACRSM